LPEVAEGVTCDKAAFKACGKAFLFIGSGADSVNVMLKLRESLAEAAKLAAKTPSAFKIGGHDWVTIVLAQTAPLPGCLPGWIEESYRLLAPKALAKKLADAPLPKPAKKSVRKRRAKT
jgi:predicted DNA-binding protein (MmcQ/YjbR family)